MIVQVLGQNPPEKADFEFKRGRKNQIFHFQISFPSFFEGLQMMAGKNEKDERDKR